MVLKVNERHWNGVPKMSGSSINENMLCLARFKASSSFKDYDTEDATMGTELHSYMENNTPLEDILDSNHQFIIKECRNIEEKVIQLFGLQGKQIREPRLWIKDDNGEGVMSGQIDLLIMDGDQAAIIDYKMLYGHYEPADRNKQLQAYGSLVAQNYPEIQSIKLALIQPALGKYSTSEMSRAQANVIINKIKQLSVQVEDPNAEMTPGPVQCKYCKALAHCPAAYEFLKNEINKEIDMENVSNEELAEKLGMVGVIERFGKSVKATAKSRLESGIDIPGYKLRNTGSVTSFDAVGASEILFSANLPVKEFLQSTKISEPDLVKIWAKHTGQNDTDAKKDLRQRLEQVMFRKEKAKSVSNA